MLSEIKLLYFIKLVHFHVDISVFAAILDKKFVDFFTF